MRIGFLNNQIDNRGTGNAVFDYAHYNEVILGNESIILTFRDGNHDPASMSRFAGRFDYVFTPKASVYKSLDVLYHIKSGAKDGFDPMGIPYVVHSVFDNDPHGDRYATISKWMGARFEIPYVPHMVNNYASVVNLRGTLGIPEDAIVFGRHGGQDTFDISFVWDVIDMATIKRKDIWFLFMNTNEPDFSFSYPERIIFIAPTVEPMEKAAFLDTCDAMIHARSRGETFGIAVGEFAIRGKPVITYGLSGEKAHIKELGQYGLYYDNADELYETLVNFERTTLPALYTQYNPIEVMRKFKEVFLDGFDTGNKS